MPVIPLPGIVTNDVVAEAWLKTMTGLPVGHTLTSSTVPGGFARYFVVVSNEDHDMAPLGSRTMRVQIDVYYSGPVDSPPWGKSGGAAEAIARSVPRDAAESIPGLSAVIHQAWIEDGPTRGTADAASLARFTMDAVIIWSPIA